MDGEIPKCKQCGCPGNIECTYPPEEWPGCELDPCGVCKCCNAGINRMTYRPEEDGQIKLM